MSLSVTTPPEQDITQILKASRRGDEGALARLLPLVYEDLRRIARAQLGRVGANSSLDPTDLVHEAYFKLVDPERASYQDRRHFFGIASRAMRQVLVDHARFRSRLKRGGGRRRVTLDDVHLAVSAEAEQLLELDEALSRLGERDPRLVRVVECRFFLGLSERETAEALGISERTVQRDWRRAKAWLRVTMGRRR